MTPARLKLKQHNEAIAALKAQIAEYGEHHQSAARAEADLRDAQAALDALADREADRFRDHVVHGGAAPEPLTDLRQEVQRRLDEARSSAEQARERSEAVRVLTHAATARLASLHQGIYGLAREAVLEDARQIAQRMYRSFAEASAAEAALYGIRDALMARRDGAHAVTIDVMLAGGEWPLPNARREEMRKRAEELRASFARALDRLEVDPTACFGLDAHPVAQKDRAA